MIKHSLVIHGGAGTILKKHMTPEREASYLSGLKAALNAGFGILESGGSALSAVETAVIALEDNILFNAGKGSVFAKDGSHEMDASIMDGRTMKAGAVAAVKNIRNPIELAIAVMEKSQHVILQGSGANEFARAVGVRTEPDEYFFSQFRYDQWQQLKGSDEAALDHNVIVEKKKFGTVGAVACDRHGNLAAATSTGGMTNKQFGRIGDSAIIGAGNYANNKTCAISCTGNGESFIRAVTAYDVSCLMEYKGMSLAEAARVVVHDKLPLLEGEGGLIGVDGNGEGVMVFNSEGMYRAMKDSDGYFGAAIYA
jgi:L-asparaginase / beta-aspartyl-peptidase